MARVDQGKPVFISPGISLSRNTDGEETCEALTERSGDGKK